MGEIRYCKNTYLRREGGELGCRVDISARRLDCLFCSEACSKQFRREEAATAASEPHSTDQGRTRKPTTYRVFAIDPETSAMRPVGDVQAHDRPAAIRQLGNGSEPYAAIPIGSLRRFGADGRKLDTLAG